jgi:hypothetical protein
MFVRQFFCLAEGCLVALCDNADTPRWRVCVAFDRTVLDQLLMTHAADDPEQIVTVRLSAVQARLPRRSLQVPRIIEHPAAMTIAKMCERVGEIASGSDGGRVWTTAIWGDGCGFVSMFLPSVEGINDAVAGSIDRFGAHHVTVFFSKLQVLGYLETLSPTDPPQQAAQIRTNVERSTMPTDSDHRAIDITGPVAQYINFCHAMATMLKETPSAASLGRN